MYPSTTTLLLTHRAAPQDLSSSSPPPSSRLEVGQPSDLPANQLHRDCDLDLERIDLEPSEQGGARGGIAAENIATVTGSEMHRPQNTNGHQTLDSDWDLDIQADLSPSPRNRKATLSPLKTLFPHRSTRGHERTLSANPSTKSGSPYSHSSFFSSTTSLRMTMSTTSFSTLGRGENFLSRTLLPFRLLDRRSTSSPPCSFSPHESLDAWEVVDSSDSLKAGAGEKQKSATASPDCSTCRHKSVRITEEVRVDSITPEVQPTGPSEQPIHPLSLRDRKVQMLLHPKKPARRSPAPPPARVEPLIPQGPTETTVRTRRAITPPTAINTREPASVNDCRQGSVSVDSLSIFQRALVTPLPLSPIEEPHSQDDPDSIALPLEETVLVKTASSPPYLASPLISASTERDLMTLSIPLDPISAQAHAKAPLTSRPESDSTSTRQHYRGRPLPATPGSGRTPVDSLYASQRDEELGGRGDYFSEGLLIDLNDTCRTAEAALEPSQPNWGGGTFPSSVPSSRSSIGFSESPTDVFSSLNATALSSPAAKVARSAVSGPLEVSDLDALVPLLDERPRNAHGYEVSFAWSCVLHVVMKELSGCDDVVQSFWTCNLADRSPRIIKYTF